MPRGAYAVPCPRCRVKRSLRAIETHGAKLVYQNALRTYVLIANNVSDGILAPLRFLAIQNLTPKDGGDNHLVIE